MKEQQPADRENIVSFPYDEIGNLFGVSRTHIRRLMKRAEAEGLVRLLEDGGRQIEILPTLNDVFENMVAAHIA
ncbi:winged helix-turn-helix domain-containing protein, partial [Mycobacterium tuberculosis]|nr:winged helix-turn-helix domain-containing protein [Mycobacterium tuberculosis]